MTFISQHKDVPGCNEHMSFPGRETNTNVFCVGAKQSYSAPALMRSHLLSVATQPYSRQENNYFPLWRITKAQIQTRIGQI